MPLHRYASPYVGLLLCCLAVQWPRILAGDMPGESSAASISGSVVDAEGGPVAGATVWLTRANFPQQSEVLQRVTADAAGRFILRDPTRDEKPNRWLTLAARDAKGRLGAPISHLR